MFKEFLKNKFENMMISEETEFMPAAVEVVETPVSPVARTILYALFIWLTSVLIWSFIGTVDEVATVPGKIIPAGYVKAVQAEDKGIVKSINVTEGQKVTKGQVLVELDPTITQADFERLKKDVAYYTLEIDRLNAERQNRPFSPDLSKLELDKQDVEYQIGLNQTRTFEYQLKLATAEAGIQQNEANLASSIARKEQYAGMLDIARDKEGRIEQLIEQDAVAYFTLLDQRSQRFQYLKMLAAQEADINRCQSAILQSREQMASIQAERNRDIATQMVESRRRLKAQTEELKKAQEKYRLSQIVAPIDGTINQLSIHTVGGIVTAAQMLMMIVPEDAQMEIEAWIANKDIGFVTIGQKAEIKVDAFSFQKFGLLDAQVREISPDAVERADTKDKTAVYRAILTLDKGYMDVADQQRTLTPGMTVNAEIKIRQKKIIEFFFDSFRKYKSGALKER